MLKNILIALFLALLVFVGVELRSLAKQKESIVTQFDEVNKELEQTKIEKGRLEADLRYFSIPENLDKELRFRFHYQAPDEKVLILVPRESTSTSAGNPQ